MFYSFEKRADALTAIQQMNGSKLEDDSSNDILPLVVKFADTEHEKQKRKQKKRQTQRPVHLPNHYLVNNPSNYSSNATNNMNTAMFSYPLFQHQMMMNNNSRRNNENEEELSNDQQAQMYHPDVMSHFHMAYYGHPVPPHLQHLGLGPQSLSKDKSEKLDDDISKNTDTNSNTDVRNYLHNYTSYYNPYVYSLPPQYYTPNMNVYDESVNVLGDSSNTRKSTQPQQINSEKETEENVPKAEAANLFIFHLPGDVDDTKLFELFCKFGEIESVKVIRDTKTSLSKGYGFVKYCHMDSAIEAVSQMNSYKIGKKHLKVSFKTDGINIPMTSASSILAAAASTSSANNDNSPTSSQPLSSTVRIISRDTYSQKP